MGQLTNQYVSSSYQGLLKMTDSTTGVTPTLQTVQTGDGTNTPLQISQTEVNISGSFSINNIPFSIVNTGSFVSTSSFNAYTSSIDTRIDGIEVETGSLQSQINGLNVETGSLQNQINGLATTSSLTSLSSSIAVTDLSQNNRLTSIEGITGSLATTSSLTSLSSSIATTDLGQDNRLGSLESKTGSYATTGSNVFRGNQTITGSVNQTGSMAIRGTDGTTPVILTVGHPNMGPLTIKNNGEINTFQSIQGIGMQNINTSPSNISFTNGVGDIFIYGKFQTGSVVLGLNQSSKAIVTGSLSVSNGITGSLQGTASYATQALSASWAPDNSNRNGVITTGSVGGNQSITGSLGISGTLTALSASITYLETVYETASVIYSSGSNQFGDASDDTQTLWGTVNLPTGPLTITGSLHSSDIKGTGSLFLQPNQGDARFVEIYNTSPTDTHITASGGQIFLGDDQTYVKVDNYGSVERIDVVAGNELVVSSSIVNLSGSLHQSGTFYPDVIDWISSSILQSTGSYILTTNVSGVTQYDSYQNVASELQQYINTGSLPAGLVSGSSQISYTGITDVPAGIISGSGQINNLGYAITGSNTFTGRQTILNDLEINSPSPIGTFVSIISTGTTSFLLDSPLTQFQSNGEMLFQNTISSTGSSDINFRTRNGGDITFNTFNSGSVAITGSLILSGSAGPELDVKGDVIITGSVILSGSAGVELDVKGDQNNTGSVNISGSLNVVGPVGLNLLQPNPFKQNLTILGGVNHFTSSTTLNNYLNAVTTSLSNNDTNLVMAPGGAFGGNIGIFTGSVFISGSNNLILSLGSQVPASQGRRQVIGTGNYIITAPNINTSSLTIPQITNNYNAGGLALTLTTGSSLGNNAHQFGNNINLGSITWNHPSASIASGINASNVSNNVNVGTITSITTGPTLLTSSATLSNNIISNANLALNHQSSSINFSQNIVGGNGLTFNNRFFNTGSNNVLTATANILGGQVITVTAAGSPATNLGRTLVGNLIGGQTVNVSLEATGSDNAGLRNSLIYGQGLNVSGSHSAASTNQNSITLLGRWNGQDNGLADSARTVFAVGTGTADGTRRTGLYVTSGSLVGVSGSMLIQGNTSISSSTNALTVTGSAIIQHNVAAQPALTVLGQSASQPGLVVSGTTKMYETSGFPLDVYGTINSQRLHFNTNPFNSNVSSNLAAIRMSGDNQTFQYTNYDIAQITTQSFIDQIVNTGSLVTKTSLGARYAGTEVKMDLTNTNGTRVINLVSDSTIVTGSLRVTGDVMFASGSNTTMGTVALDGANPGTATVSNTLVTANSLIYLTKQTNNHPNAGPVVVSSKGSSTFTITSNHNGDTDTVAYLIINPS